MVYKCYFCHQQLDKRSHTPGNFNFQLSAVRGDEDLVLVYFWKFQRTAEAHGVRSDLFIVNAKGQRSRGE